MTTTDPAGSRAPEPGVDDPSLWQGEAELVVNVVPFLQRAHELLNRKVIVFIAGGIRVDGTLRDVDDEQLVLVIEDEDLRYDVAIESIAVLAVKR